MCDRLDGFLFGLDGYGFEHKNVTINRRDAPLDEFDIYAGISQSSRKADGRFACSA
jgi:hypothetical protein